MNETITFPEDRIPEVVRVIRAGLLHAERVSVETRAQLARQCAELERYYKQLTEDTE